MKSKKDYKLSFGLINALSDENRLKIILFLSEGERCVCQIFENLNLAQNLVSHHLKILREKKLISSRKDGRWVRYSLNKDKVKELRVFFDKIVKTKELTSKCKFNN